MGPFDQRQELKAELEKLVDFYESHHNPQASLNLRAHQITRVYEALKRGHTRLLCADSTSAGKTLSALAIKAFLDREQKRKTQALVFAPRQAMLSAWTQEEINGYYSKLGLPSNTVKAIQRPGDLADLNSDFVVINYDKFSKEDKEGNNYRSAIMHNLHRFGSTIFDEGQNLANITSCTTRSIIEIIEKTKNKPCSILSATPIPNRLHNAGFMLYMIDPDRFKNYATEKFEYSQDKYAIKDLILEGRWLTFTREDVKEIFNLPELTIHPPTMVEIEQKFAEQYFNEWAKLDDLGRIQRLRSILNHAKVSRLESMLDGMRDRQTAVFTFLKKGFFPSLVEAAQRVYGKNAVGFIDGDVSIERRIELAKQFSEGTLKNLILTAETMGEGIPLTTYERPSSMIMFEPAISPREYDQMIGRLYRAGQTAPVDIFEMIAFSKWLEDAMTGKMPGLEEEFDVEFRKSWEPTTTDLDRYEIRKKKCEINERVQRGYSLSEALKIYANIDEDSDKDSSNESAYGSVQNAPKKKTPNQVIMSGARSVRNSIGRGIKDLDKNPGFEIMIESYSMSHEEYLKTTSAENNLEVGKIITEIEKQTATGKLEKIIDIGCGTACLARVMNRPIYNFDMSKKMLDNGKKICEDMGIYKKLKIEDYFIQGDMKHSALPDKAFDIATMSQAMQYNSQSNGRREVEDIFIEANRILKNGGYFISSLTGRTTTEKEYQDFAKHLSHYGFKIVKSQFFDLPSSKNGFYMVVGQKTGDVHDYVPKIFEIYHPKRPVATGGLKKSDLAPKNYGGGK